MTFVCRDIENFNCHCWAEVSGVMEHYYKKHKGYPIPNIYAPSLLKKPNLTLDEDRYHYLRQIGLPDDNGEVKMDRKCIFGFQSEELYNKINETFEDYVSFRDYVISDDNVPQKNQGESVGDRYMFMESGMPRIVNDAIGYIEYIEEMVYENDTNLTCMTPNMYSMLQKAVDILTNSINTTPGKFKEQIQANIEMGENLLSETYPIQIHPLNPTKDSTQQS